MKPVKRAKLFAADRERLLGGAVEAGGKAIQTRARLGQAALVARGIKTLHQLRQIAAGLTRLF